MDIAERDRIASLVADYLWNHGADRATRLVAPNDITDEQIADIRTRAIQKMALEAGIISNEPTRVVINVQGGVAKITEAPSGIDVIVVDYDVAEEAGVDPDDYDDPAQAAQAIENARWADADV